MLFNDIHQKSVNEIKDLILKIEKKDYLSLEAALIQDNRKGVQALGKKIRREYEKYIYFISE